MEASRRRRRRRRRGRRRPRRCHRSRRRRAARSSSSRRETASAADCSTSRSAASRTSSAASGSRRTRARCTRSSPSSGSRASTPTAKATTSTSTPDGELHRYARRRRPAAAGLGRRLRGRPSRSSTPSSPSSIPRRRGSTRGRPSSTAITFEQWLAAEVDDTLARDFLRSYMAGGYMTKPADTFSLLSASATVAGAGSVANLFEPDLCLHSRIVGGSQLIPLRLAERLGDRVDRRRSRAHAPLDRRRRRGRGGRDAPCARRAAVVAVPPNVAGFIRFEPVAPRVADAAPPGDDAGRRDQGARRLRRAVLARRGALRRGFRAVPARPRGLRQHPARRAPRRALHVPRGREGAGRRATRRLRAAASRARGLRPLLRPARPRRRSR